MPKKKQVAGLAEHLGYWLRYVSNHVSAAFQAKVEAHGVTVAEWVVLRAAFDVERIQPSLLAEQLGMTRGTISKLVDRLIAKRLAVCRTEKEDRRFQTVTLTPAGRQLVPDLAAEADRNDAEFFGHLTAEERTALRRTLEEIVRRREFANVPTE